MKRLAAFILVLFLVSGIGAFAQAPSNNQASAPSAVQTTSQVHPGYYVSNAPDGPRMDHPLVAGAQWPQIVGALAIICVMLGILMYGIGRGVKTRELTRS